MTELPQSEHPKEKLGDFMTTPVISIDVKASVQEAAHLMGTEMPVPFSQLKMATMWESLRKEILHERWLEAGSRYPLPYPRS